MTPALLLALLFLVLLFLVLVLVLSFLLLAALHKGTVAGRTDGQRVLNKPAQLQHLVLVPTSCMPCDVGQNSRPKHASLSSLQSV